MTHVWRGVIDEHIFENRGPILPRLAEEKCLARRQLTLSRKLLRAEGYTPCQACSGMLGVCQMPVHAASDSSEMTVTVVFWLMQ